MSGFGSIAAPPVRASEGREIAKTGHRWPMKLYCKAARHDIGAEARIDSIAIGNC